jgi:hypothetical protein
MSDARAARRRQARSAARCKPLPAGYGVLAAWCATEDDLPEARRRSHDGLVKLMADRRIGGVEWRHWSGDEANKALDVLRAGAVGPYADHYRRLAGLLREHGGFLVAAMAPSNRDRGPA